MARGDFTLFQQFTQDIGKGLHDFSSDTIKLGLIDNSITPAADDVDPKWSSYSAAEVVDTGGYTAGGETLLNSSYTISDNTSKFDADNIEFIVNIAGFTDAYYGILYNDSTAQKLAIAFLDLGGPIDETTEEFSINWNSSGVLTVTKVV